MTRNSTDDMKTRIIREAIQLFGERGFDGTSIQSIAETVGIRKPSLLYHFKSKEELRDEAIKYLISRWVNELPRLLTNAVSGYDRFSSIIMSLVSFFLKDENRARFAMREMLDRPGEIGELVKLQLSPWNKMIVDYIELGQKGGTIRKDLNPRAYIMQVMLMVLGSVAMGGVASVIFELDSEPSGARIDELVRIARESLFTRAGPA